MHCNNGNEEAGTQGSPLTRGESRLQRFVSQAGDEDARSRYREEEADNNAIQHNHGSISSGNDDRTIIAFEPNDRENPYNWKKALIVLTSMVTVVNSTMGSALPSNAIPYFTKEWEVTSQMQRTLPIAIFLVGYIFGPIVWAPLSEQFGRRWLIVGTFAVFCIWTLACALAPNWPAFLVFRLLVGVFASAPIALVTGIMADVYGEHRTRGRAMASYFAVSSTHITTAYSAFSDHGHHRNQATVFGPLFAPIISGFCSPTIGWRWTFWIGLIYAGLSMALLLLLPETYGPILLVKRAQRIRRLDPKANVIAPHELEAADLHQLAVRVLTRPMRMLFFELIVSATCVYLALCYGIFYMTFQAYPIIFEEMYGLSPGVEGLCFLPIGAGALCALPVFFSWDAYLEKAQAEGRP
ncbi:hypothetical protein INS49_013600 [Diaporthe citri]|uniref:uncharacterized protein n=1 Tax=Diaporthe citri TaxID=83186 RepID=UPI001C7F1002|nr:uncharacterized protein INS49_013600 [Diaporthe citri]KAG6357721.1 hypothetical protein INS49_013600 [Diaporthe citri]